MTRFDSRPLGKLLERTIDYRGKSVPKALTGVPLITARNVRAGFLDLSATEFIAEDSYAAWMSRGHPRSGDILFTTEAPLGNAAMFPTDGRYAVGQRIIVLRTNPDLLDPRYLHQFLLADVGQQRLKVRASGSTALGIRASELAKVPIDFPPLQEQRFIGNIAELWDSAIVTLEHLIQSKRDRKGGLMQVLLTGRKRFPRYRSSGAFRRLRLGQLAEVDRHSLPSNTPTDRKFHYVSLSDIYRGRISDDLPVLEFSQAPSRARKLVAQNDILLATVRPNLQAFALVGAEASSLVVSTGFAVLSARSELDPQYLFQYLFSSDMTGQIESVVAGSNYPAISTRDVRKLNLNIPTIEEQRDIAAVLSTADVEIENLEKQLDAYKLQKRGLMQQLLTGKKRVMVDKLEAVA